MLECGPVDLATVRASASPSSGATDADDCGVLENTATVAAANEPATALGNNSDGASITVNCADILIDKEPVDRIRQRGRRHRLHDHRHQ